MVHRTTACEAARHVADELTWAGAGITPDLKHTKLLLNFGANYHEGEQTARWLDWQTVMSREQGLTCIALRQRCRLPMDRARESGLAMGQLDGTFDDIAVGRSTGDQADRL